VIDVRRGAHAGCDATGMPAPHRAAAAVGAVRRSGFPRSMQPANPGLTSGLPRVVQGLAAYISTNDLPVHVGACSFSLPKHTRNIG
jgi:hypothetical protein